MSEVVKCTFEGCEKTATGVEEGWLCSKHRAENIKNENSFPFILQQKIEDCVEIERTQCETINGKPPGLFMLRELAQNADDCEAEILVLEFRSDGLYIYNDGRAFTQKDKNEESPDDFNRLVNILTRPKALDPDTTGSYGSGFQTVYYVTNTPEVHSYFNHLRYNPTKKEDHMVSSCESEMSIDSPYLNNGKNYGGTVFRLPWRQEHDSALSLDESKIGISSFAKWDEKSIRFMFEQFKSYSHDLILCANNLKIFRVLWNFKDNSYRSDNNLKGYQVQKGELDGLWDLGYIYNDGNILNVIEGPGSGGYLLEQWNYENRNISEYLICSDFVRKNDYVEFITKPKGQNYTINNCEIPSDDYVEERRRYEECKRRVKAVKRSEIHVLIPLQKRSNGFFPPTYCTIPFAKKSGNNFIISGPFFSKENRIEMKFHTEAEGEWFRDVLEQIVRLYIRAYRLFIHEMERRYESNSINEYVLQDLIISNLPSEKIDNWVGAEGVLETVTEDFLNNIQDLLYKGVFCERIYFHEGELLKLISVNGERLANFTDQDYMSSLLRKMGFLVIEESFFQRDRFNHKGLQNFVDLLKNDISISEEDFIKLYYCFIGEVDNEHEIDENKKKSISEACAINSIYGKGKMDFDFISDLINYWLKESKDENKDCLPIFANKKNNLLSANQLLRAPSGKFFELEEILPDNKTLHTDFIKNSQLLEKIKEIKGTKQGIEDLLKGIDEHHPELEDKDTDQLINIIILAYEWIKETGVDLSEVTSEMESDIKIILNHNCNLVPLNCVAWMPYKHYEIISTLLSDSPWLDHLLNGTLLENFEDLFKKHLNWVRYPRIINEFIDKIQGEDTVYRKRQKIIVEGILEGLIENQWKKEDITNLAFLPVSGTLVEPDKACLGTVFDADIRDFLSVVDDEIQEVINSYAGGKQIMLDAGMHDINAFSMKVKWICNRIHEFSKSVTYDSNSNRELSEEEHLRIINCLSMIDWKNIKDIDVYEKNILPLRLNERIFLGSAPYSLKNVETKRLKEIYKRDYPFAPLPSESINEVHHLIQQSVRVLDLQNNNQLEIDISKSLNLLPLIDKSGQGKRRLFLMHFVIPSKGGAEDDEPSLFFDEVLEDFICKPLRKDEIEKIKKSLLPMVMELYEGTEHSGGDYEASNKPCLCREKNGVLEWYRPIDAVIGLKEDIPILKIKRPDIETLKKFVSDDFDIEGALSKIGVPNDVSFEKIKEAIDRTLNSEDKIDKKTLLDILHFSLSKNIGKKENWERIEWIPVCDGPFINAEHVLAPTAKIKKILGEYYVDSLLDIDDLEFDFEDNVYLNMGMRTTMDSEEIIDLWNKKQQSSDTDSGCLFKEIKEKIDDIPTAELKELKYFYKGKWYVPRNVYLIEPNSVPEILKKNNCLFLGENYPDHLIIKKLREAWEVGEPILSADNILKECVHVQDMETLEELWKYLIQNNSIIEPTHKEKYGGEKIFPCDGGRYAPENVLILYRSGKNLKFTGKLNDVYILDNWQILCEIDTLLMLGASKVAEVLNDIPKLQNILMHIMEEKPEHGSDLWLDFVTLISILMEKDAKLPDFNLIPIDNGYEIDYKRPKNVVIKDEDDIWTLFKDEQRLNFFDPEIFSDDDIPVEPLIQWFKRCGANDFKELLKSKEPTQKDAEYIPEFTEKFRKYIQDFVETGITEFTSSDKLKIIQHINDLIGDDITRFSIYSCEHITRQYCIDMGAIDGGTPISKKVSANHHFDRSTSTLFIHREDEDSNLIKEFVKMEFNPGFGDMYWNVFWEKAVESAFNEDSGTVSPQTDYRAREIPNLRSNLKILDEWWGEYNSTNTNRSSYPTLDGDFWWPALGFNNQGDESKRDSLLKEQLFKDRKRMFNIFSMATLLGANVGRTQIKNYIRLLDDKGLSFSEIYDMEEEVAIKKIIDDIFTNINHENLQEKHYPDLRRRFFDILLLRRAMKDEYIGENIIEMLKIHIDDGQSPENFLTSGRVYGSKPFMRGFKGLFTGQIYFIIREAVRLGLAKNWDYIAFHAPSQVSTLIENLGGDMPEGGREGLAKMMIEVISGYDNLRMWHDIPFFMYYDEFCRDCRRGSTNPHNDCKMQCHRKW